ncbi:hypothetical protein BP5796_00529 [Coleophoma crateriformis]|uniref:Serine/threonine-protein kinase Tel1 n=1 Tax=Coleophoma crateriformis TaxID=565419 RepID=A0A3D8T893_9HELO|nr:hypothetical protein BP5796_00529 [Coleophoma crateriformis]
MGQPNGDKGEVRLDMVLDAIREGNQKQRTEGLKDLRAIFDKPHRAANVDSLTDKAYHRIFEVIFKVVLTEKQSFLAAKKTTAVTALTRLTYSADVVRVIVRAGASRLKTKTVQAVIDHITQTLPTANGEYCAPLSQHYLRALGAVLEPKANVEHLKRSTWLDVVDFCLLGVRQYLDEVESESSGISRSFSDADFSHASRSQNRTPRNAVSQKQSSAISRRNAEDLLQCLFSLVTSPNAPVLEREDPITSCVLVFLRSQSTSVSHAHQLAFSIMNSIIPLIHADRITLCQSIAQDVVPIITRFWQAKTVAKDEMLNSVRDEMLILLFNIQLFLERLVLDDAGDIVLQLSDLLQVLKTEYSRRSGRDRLQLDDIEMAEDAKTSAHHDTPLHLNLFQLRPHNPKSERNWANVQVIGILEYLLHLNDTARRSRSDDIDDFDDYNEQPRKRQRLTLASRPITDTLISDEEDVRASELQILLFFLQSSQLSVDTLQDLLRRLVGCVADKRGNIDSWALLCIASCTYQKVVASCVLVDWTQFWYAGLRCVTLSATCRAASVQLHSLLANGLLQYHEISEDVSAMITAADVSGPAVLCDSSALLMMHILHVRVSEVPGASLQACQHVMRWLFDKWKACKFITASTSPKLTVAAERSLVVNYVHPHGILDLLRTTLGLPRSNLRSAISTPCGSIGQAWRRFSISRETSYYLLLLDRKPEGDNHCQNCPSYESPESTVFTLDTSHFREIRKLMLELLLLKVEAFLHQWTTNSGESSSYVSLDSLKTVVQTFLCALLLVPHMNGCPASQFEGFLNAVKDLVQVIFQSLKDTDITNPQGSQAIFETLLQSVCYYIPTPSSTNILELSELQPTMLDFLIDLNEEVNRRQSSMDEDTAVDDDLMDIDDEFSTQKSRSRAETQRALLPREILALDSSHRSFQRLITGRLALTVAMAKSPETPGVVPSSFMDHLLSLEYEELLFCHQLLLNVIHSDLTLNEEDAVRLVEQLGALLMSNEYERCEIAQCLCAEVLLGTVSTWTLNGSGLTEGAIDIYTWFIEVALDKDITSPKVQKDLADLLLRLHRIDPKYWETLAVPSPRTGLLKIIESSNASVKFHVGKQLPSIFERYLLKDHEKLFLDVLEQLPSDPDWLEGIAYRLKVIANIGSAWPTLLRRCIYHIVEAPGNIPGCVPYAKRCLLVLSSALGVESPRELFTLFASQILFTWLEVSAIQTLPYQIFGFHSLKDLIEESREEMVALMIMRGQEEAIEAIAAIIGISIHDLVRIGFSKAMAYSVAQDFGTKPTTKGSQQVRSETRLRNMVGKDSFLEYVNIHFVDIIATLFDVIDIHQESSLEKYLGLDPQYSQAAGILQDIRTMSTSTIDLPASQQPHFRAKYLKDEIHRICSRTMHEIHAIYTPALTISIARRLFDTIHPALGPLHACAVLRKIRVLIAMSGTTAYSGYPLEMLLHSLRPFITRSECAGDAIGMVRYLLEAGREHLQHEPTFLAGIMLSMLAPLRAFLQSTQPSTTQESQYRATISKAQEFHKWLGQYLTLYNSPSLSESQKEKLLSMLEFAHRIRARGNGEPGSPESSLLKKLLEDEQSTKALLSPTSRNLALKHLSSNFQCPASFRSDILGSDDAAISTAASVWRSCKEGAGDEYLAWAARVLGRAFAASGHLHQELLKESSVKQMKELTVNSMDVPASRISLLGLVHALTLGDDHRAAGLAESALRAIVSTSDGLDDDICRHALSKHFYSSCQWSPYHIPPSDTAEKSGNGSEEGSLFLQRDALSHPHWVRNISIWLTRSVSGDPLLDALDLIVEGMIGFAEKAFPFILHIVLLAEVDDQQKIRSRFSRALGQWLDTSDDKANLKLLINSILYLRTQPLPHEKSSADRANWLEIDHIKAASAAAKCGMYKTALLFVEEYQSAPTKSSRKSSSFRSVPDITNVPAELLLDIFRSIDDPDLYYGVQQDPSLGTILSRLEYENDGAKSLAFRSAQYDDHLRGHNFASAHDVQSLVHALDVLNLSGLSHTLLQGQQTAGMSKNSLDSMFRTARKLEQWDIPVPNNHQNNAVTVYKAFQAVHVASDRSSITTTLNEVFCNTMLKLTQEDLNADALHDSLRSLAVLTELDEVVSCQGSEQFEEMLARFEGRSSWMRTGRFEDMSQILSCRGTTLSTLSQQPRLHAMTKIKPEDTRLVQVQTSLLSSSLHRSHNALQESLAVATTLMSLVAPCQTLGLSIEATAQLEAANALWDQGEMTSSIGMLKILDKDSTIRKQTLPVGRSELLSKIGYQVSVAKLEKPDHIIEKYLEPSLKELKGKTSGSEAGQVFHQFALFCDQQLEDPDSLEDLKRLEKLSEMKENEVNELAKLYRSASTARDKERYRGHSTKAKQWLKLDQQELQRQSGNRDEFLRQSLENYLLALAACDDHDHNALRFSAMWLQHSENQIANQAVSKYLNNVPSRKFASLTNQLTSRLLDSDVTFQQLLFNLVIRICTDHPFHGMYQIFAGISTRANQKDDTAVSRLRAMRKVDSQLTQNSKVASTWTAIVTTNKAYCRLAAEKDDDKYKGGRKIAIRDSPTATVLRNILAKFRIPPPTMQIEIAADLNYSKVPIMTGLDPTMSIATGVSAPKIITAIGSNGRRFRQLVKGGNDDLRQDAIMEQVFAQVSELLKMNRSSRRRNLSIRTYKVLPLTASAGVIEFVPNTMPLHDYLMPAHERYYPKDLKGNMCRREIGEVQTKPLEVRIAKFRSVTERFHPVMRYFFTEKFDDPDEWFNKRLAYTRSTAAISILGYVLGLGDRHGHNILLDADSGEVVHIDLGVAFEMGRVLPVPELVPFRLTRDIVDGMGITKTEGVFRRCCEFTLDALRKEVYSIMTILDVLRYDPLYSWSISPVRLAKLQDAQSDAPEPDPSAPGEASEKAKQTVNEPSEADRALTVVNKKLSKTLSVQATVNDLINQATDERNLAVLYSGKSLFQATPPASMSWN